MGEDEDMKSESGLRQFLGGLTQVILLKSACFIETIGDIQSPNDGSLYNSRRMEEDKKEVNNGINTTDFGWSKLQSNTLNIQESMENHHFQWVKQL